MIGVFDSGIGGLTVLRELLCELPECGFVYLGDTARTPYGSKSPETVRRYAREDAQFLLERSVRLIVIACNTASALAADALSHAFSSVPVVEVVTPAVEAACAATRNGRIGVIGTRATIASGVYEQEIKRHLPMFEVFGEACPLLVPLAEEGWLNAPETASIIERYLAPLRAASVDTLILGCTHYPLFINQIALTMGEEVKIINPARATARAVGAILKRDRALAAVCRGTNHSFCVTDRTPHFERIAVEWLGMPIALEAVELSIDAAFARDIVVSY